MLATRPPDLLHRLYPLKRELNEYADKYVNQGPDGEMGADWVVFGSFVLLLHGLREGIGDVDVFVAPSLWVALSGTLNWRLQLPNRKDPPLLERLVGGVRVHAFYAWTTSEPVVTAEEAREQAEVVGVGVDAWPCVPLSLIRRHKIASREYNPGSVGHNKHRADIAAIDGYLGGQA
jgi:hypothetical protein